MRLIGHNYIYAAEQIALSLFRDEIPEFTSELRELPDGVFEAITVIGERSHTERSPVSGDETERTRQLQRLIKLSFYHAAVQVLGEAPPWGAVSGVKPTQLVLKGYDLERDFFATPERAELCKSTAKYANSALERLSERDVNLYVGIPFCPTRCSYCSFVSQSVERSLKLIEPYLDALEREITAVSARLRERGERVRALYIGGGTPTTLSAAQLTRLIVLIREAFDLAACEEFTVEAGRPDTITREKLDALQSGGVTRVSVNPQTMNDAVLATIGRKHSSTQTLEAFRLVREAGFECVNMDFIAGLPTESAESFHRSIDAALELAPENITLHTLARKRGSTLNESGETAGSGKTVGAMLDYAFAGLRERGYEPYYLYRQKFTAGGFENTGWTLPQHESFYNICMMEELCSVYALGAGGSTKLKLPNGKLVRSFNPKYPQEYIDANIFNE